LFLAGGGKTAGDGGIINAPLRQDIFAGDGQGRLGCFEVGIVGERQLNQLIERRGMKQGPPVAGDVTAIGKVLGFAAGNIGGGDGR